MEKNKEQVAKLNQNNKQTFFAKSYNMGQGKGINPNNQPYMDQRKKSPVNVKFTHPGNIENIEKGNQPCNTNLFRGQRSKLLQQQKDKFRYKYTKFTSDFKQPKDDSLKFDPLVNPVKIYFKKTKSPDELKRALACERKISTSNDQEKSKKLNSKEKLLQIQQNSIVMNRISITSNVALSPEHSKPDFFGTMNKGYLHDHESEDINRGLTSNFYHGRRSEVVRNIQDLSLENEIEKINEDNYFPNIIGNDKHEEENIYSAVESVPHKLPNLSNKYRKMLKESSSDDSECKLK